MADYSYVTVEVDDTPETRRIIDEWKADKYGAYVDPSTFTDPSTGKERVGLQVVVEEASYGFPGLVRTPSGAWESAYSGDEDVAELLIALMNAGIAWNGRDGGGYEWPEAEYAWEPGDETVRSRTLSGGEPVLTLSEWGRILDDIAHPDGYGAVEVVRAVKLHFQPLRPD